jgi:hypothetical protein
MKWRFQNAFDHPLQLQLEPVADLIDIPAHAIVDISLVPNQVQDTVEVEFHLSVVVIHAIFDAIHIVNEDQTTTEVWPGPTRASRSALT